MLSVFAFQASGGLEIETAWLISAIMALLGTLSAVIAVLYRGQVAALQSQIDFLKEEGKRKDERAERLLEQLDRVADVQDRGLSLVEAERRRR